MDATRIRRNIEAIKKEIGPKVKLVAVTKTVDIETIKILKTLGISTFGENKIQDAEEKIMKLPNAEWHMIGHVQSNKAKKAANLFSMMQSIDSVEIAKKISDACEDTGKIMPILIELNIAREPQKYGFFAEQAEMALKEISKLPNIKIEGFMLMAPFVEPEKTRPYFKEAKKLFDHYKTKYNLTTLSMGMSNDYKIAVQEGSTMVRIGTKLFE